MPAKIDDALKKRAAQMRAEGVPVKKTAEATGLSESTIVRCWREWVSEYGIERLQDLPDADQKKRAVHLKMQGWSNADVSANIGLSSRVIGAHWREWAMECGIELPETRPAPQTAGSSNEVTSYLIDPKTGERLTDPVTETVELSTKSMPSDSAGIGGSTMRDVIERHTQLQQTQKKAAKAAAVSNPDADEPPAPEPSSDPAPKKPASFELVAEPQGYNPFAPLDNINHLIWEQIRAGDILSESWSSSVDIGSGALTMTFTLPLMSAKEE